MGIRKFKYARNKGTDPTSYALLESDFNKFDSSLLNLGDISTKRESFEAIAAIFDLKDFTAFCDQRDPRYEVPKYLSAFLAWLFESLAQELRKRRKGEQIILWGPLPFFAKFLGDGVLLLWEANALTAETKINIIVALQIICSFYETKFLPKHMSDFTNPPPSLRCGIAVGEVTTIGDKRDFVGLCINIAARLQKLEQGRFSFACSQKGLELQEDWLKKFILIKVPIRGIKKQELVYVLEKEFNALSDEKQKRLLP